MRVCPECETEFENENIEVCPNCDVPLMDKEEGDVEAPDVDDSNLPSDGLVVIETTIDEGRVGKLRELLEESGIPCFLSDELFTNTAPSDETMVMIPREMEGDAKRLIRDYLQ
ncbi:DUF2007 domain-containing protein [bacterium]|nr:DUF2007 domain-containing protein [bacterium]